MSNLITYALVATNSKIGMKPSSYEEAMRCANSDQWKAEMEDEMKSFYKNNSWRLVKKKPHHKVIMCKWVYKLKSATTQRDHHKYKARLIIKGFT